MLRPRHRRAAQFSGRCAEPLESRTLLAAGGTVQGIVWNDWDRNGVRDGFDTGRAGAPVYADLNGNGVYDADSEPGAAADYQGTYTLEGLPQGEVTIRVRLDVNPSHPDTPLVQTLPASNGGRRVTVIPARPVRADDFLVLDPAVLPDAPSGLGVTIYPGFTGGPHATLTWQPGANAASHAVERRHEPASGGSGQWTRIANVVVPSARTYDDFSVIPGNRYSYRVVAVNTAGESASSNEAPAWAVPGLGSPLKDINPVGGSMPMEMTPFRGALYFSAVDGASGRELWRTDGTTDGTTLLKNISPGNESSDPALFVPVGDTLFFTAAGADQGVELWKTDGTPDGTVLVKDIAPGPASSSPHELLAVGDTLYFIATPPAGPGGSAAQLWKSDGTAGGTVRVSDVRVSERRDGTFGPAIAASGRNVFFFGSAPESGAEFWTTDGTDAGTALVKDVYPGTQGSAPLDLIVSGTTVYFVAADPESDNTLYRSDGSAAGTLPLRHFPDDSQKSLPGALTPFGGGILFTAPDAGQFTELWKSDGTPEGTTVIDLTPGPTGSSPARPSISGEYAFFVGSPPAGFGLYRTDGTVAGTALVTPLNSFQTPLSTVTADGSGGAFFDSGDGLYRTDGTPGGTQFVHLVQDDFLINKSGVRAVLDGTLFFRADLNRAGDELYQVARTKPAGPANVEAALTPEGPRVTWDDVPTNEAGFVIERSRTADFAAVDATGWAPAFAESFVDTAYSAGATYYYRVRAYNAAGEGPSVAAPTPLTTPGPATVAGRHVFYNFSAFDGSTPGASYADDGAVDRAKVALLPEQTATAANVTSYGPGLSGIMLDIAGLGGRVPTPDAFGFRVGTGSDVSKWHAGPSGRGVSISVRPGYGDGGSDRVTILFPETSVRNAWLQVTVRPVDSTGLARPEVFYFGNLVGETGDGVGGLRVTAQDLAAVKRSINRPADLRSGVDFDRNGRVNAGDLSAAKVNLNHSLPLFFAPAENAAPSRLVVVAPAPGDRPGVASKRVRDDEVPDLLA